MTKMRSKESNTFVFNCFSRFKGPLLYIHLYLRNSNAFLNVLTRKKGKKKSYASPLRMPSTIPFSTLTLAHTWYEDSTPRSKCKLNTTWNYQFMFNSSFTQHQFMYLLCSKLQLLQIMFQVLTIFFPFLQGHMSKTFNHSKLSARQVI